MIPRRAQAAVQDALARQAAVALTGPRQVGKTTLAHTIAAGTPSVYLDLEASEDRAKLADAAAFLSRYEDRPARPGFGVDSPKATLPPTTPTAWSGARISSAPPWSAKEPGSGSFEINAHAATQRCRDVDQRVEREARDPAAQQIVNPWLRHAAAPCRLVLCPVMLSEARRDLLHQFGPCSQIRSLLGGVRNRIPNARVALGFAHVLPPNSCQIVFSRFQDPSSASVVSSCGKACRTYTASARLAK